MRKFALALTVGTAMFVVSVVVSPAKAQSAHTWVASNGADTGSCLRSAPCGSFAFALTKTDAKGEITCADSGNYGGSGNLSINKSITINCEGAIGSMGFGASSFGFIFVSTGSSDVVTLRGLDLDGLGTGCTSTCGLISFTGAGVLQLDKVKINNLRGTGSGIRFAPNGAARLDVSDSSIMNNGSTGTSAGILLKPSSGIQTQVTISRTHIENNWYGIYADGQSGGSINGVVTDSVVSGNVNNGITVISPASRVALWIDNTKVVNNAFGLRANGAAARMLVRHSTVANNQFGLSIANGGVLLTYGDNSLNGNSNGDGVFTGLVGLQ